MTTGVTVYIVINPLTILNTIDDPVLNIVKFYFEIFNDFIVGL